ncbi:WG repeat-containing protein [Gloeobacter violaceus]|nr:WG repeat-containing protein [Gloeobacter violaceus]
MKMLYPALKAGMWGYIDSVGNFSIQARFDRAEEFHEGFSLVVLNDEWCYIDQKGSPVFRTGFTNQPREFSGPVLYDKDGWIMHRSMRHFYEGRAAVWRGNSGYGYIDSGGIFVISPQFSEVDDFSEGVAAAAVPEERNCGNWGYIDREGNWIISPQFYYARHFCEGLAPVRWKESILLGYIDRIGKKIIEPSFDWAWSFSEGLAQVEVDSNHGYIDQSGRIVIFPEFEDARRFRNGFAAVRLGKQWGFIDAEGRLATEPQFDAVGEFSEGLAQVFMKNKDTDAYPYYPFKVGYIDTHGNVVIPIRYEWSTSFHAGLAVVREAIWGPSIGIDRTGQCLWKQA